ncbi:MAG TPA: hypothetical protein VM261_20575 [Kofleriaceae bacterium]|nr:hypothetical protein [Kofleriaceae bacterium]
MRLVLPLLLVFCVLGCVLGCDKKKSAGTASSAPAKVAILLDDKVLTEQVTLSGGPQPLEKLVQLPPADTWIAVEAIDGAGKVTTVLAPAKNSPGAQPALVEDARGVAFGWLVQGQLAQPVAGVVKVTVKTKSDAGKPIGEQDHGSGDSGGGGNHGTGDNSADKGVRATPTAELKIEVESPAGPSTFTGDKMVGLPEIKAPSGDTETPGWALSDVLAAAGLKDLKSVTLTDDEGVSLKLEGEDFDPAKTILYLKLNRSGVIRFRRFKKEGDVWEVAGELRGIKKIKAAS